MKKEARFLALLLSLMVLCLPKTNSQAYHSFVTSDSTYWNVLTIDGSGTPPLAYLHVILMTGDTFCRGHNYKKMSWVGSADTDLHLIGIIRETDKQVFFKSIYPMTNYYGVDTTEKMIYDFGLQAGDSFLLTSSSGPGPIRLLNYKVSNADSVQIADGTYRRRISLQLISNNNPIPLCSNMTWIEGIGTTRTPLYTESGCAFEQIDKLSCMMIKGNYIYHNFWGSCRTNAGTAARLTQHDYINIFPDPATDMLYLSSGDYRQALIHYCISDMTGKIVKSGDVSVLNSGIDISGLTSGIFYIRMADVKDHSESFRKFIHL